MLSPTRTVSTDSLVSKEHGAIAVSKSECCQSTKITYQDIFYRELKPKAKTMEKAVNSGGVYTMYGFPRQRQPWCVDRLKDKALRIPDINRSGELVYSPQNATIGQVFRQGGASIARENSKTALSNKPLSRGADKNIVIKYLGIAADEPERIKRHTKPNVELPLVAIGWEEDMCGLECEYMDLLSPIYTTSARGGCWFCHNQGVGQLRILRRDYPELWQLLLKWDSDSPVSFKADGHTVHDFDRRFALEDEGLIDPKAHFKWAMLDDDCLNYNLFATEGWK